jgi:phage/plasmid-like protein (TIGR03299 family)
MSTWNRIGTGVEDLSSIDEVLKRAQLDYDVVKVPVYYGSDKIRIPDKVATVRKSDKHLYGIVGKNYEVCQNRDAFDFVNYMGDNIKFVKAGETFSGLVYVIAELQELEVLEDKFKPYVIFQTGHNGGYTIKAAICPLRIVCENQFNIAFREAQNTISVRHNRSMESNLNEAREVLKATYDYMGVFTDRANILAKKKVSELSVEKVINTLFKTTENMSVRSLNSIEASKNDFIAAYKIDDNYNFRGTAWGLVNAWTYYMTHSEPKRKSENWEDKKFMQVTFNSSSTNEFISMVENI